MKKFKGVWGLLLTAFVLAIMVAPTSAQIIQSPNGVGDALIFPYLDADLGNTFVITNESNQWMQVHVRIRTGGQSVEGRDFPLILSPGDMAVFGVSRVADTDDSATTVREDLWTIDYTLDPNNFKYVRVDETSAATSLFGLMAQETAEHGGVFNRFENLDPRGNFTGAQKLIDTKYGYVEVIGEAVFVDGLDKAFVLDGNPTNTVREIAANKTLADVGNVLSGKAYVGPTMAYNAVAFSNFRTNDATASHRVENYLAADGTVIDSAVIVTSEHSYSNNATADDYTYDYANDRLRGTDGGHYEAMVSSNNTWGPTLADGDSYLGDDLDAAWNVPNSVREIEAVLLEQSVRGHYLASALQTRLVVMFPTKHHLANVKADYLTTNTWEDWLFVYSNRVKAIRPLYEAEIWNIDEFSITADAVLPPFQISPAPPLSEDVRTDLDLPYEVNVFGPTTNLDKALFSAGRFVLKSFKDAGTGRGLVTGGMMPLLGMSFTVDANGTNANMTATQY